MAKKSDAGFNALLVMALVFPLGVANFLLNLTFLFAQMFGFTFSTTVEAGVGIFMPFTLYLAGFVFSVLLLTKSRDVVLSTTALILNSILIINGMFLIYSNYFM